MFHRLFAKEFNIKVVALNLWNIFYFVCVLGFGVDSGETIEAKLNRVLDWLA